MKDDFTRYSWIYFLEGKADAADAFIKCWKVCVRMVCRRKYRDKYFRDVCRQYCIKQEVTNAIRPGIYGVAERANGIIHNAALVAWIQVLILYPHTGVRNQNDTATSKLGNKSSHKMWYGKAHLPHLTRLFVRGIAAGTTRRNRCPAARVTFTSGRASATPMIHCGYGRGLTR